MIGGKMNVLAHGREENPGRCMQVAVTESSMWLFVVESLCFTVLMAVGASE